MNLRRYDEIVSLVASVLFGIAIQDFKEVVGGIEKLGCSRGLCILTALSFYLVYFRNLHGLIAFDVWAEKNSAYKTSFEQKHRHLVAFFLYGLFGSILLPYLFIYNIKESSFQSHSFLFWLLLNSPIYFTILWDVPWLLTLLKNPVSSGAGVSSTACGQWPQKSWLDNVCERFVVLKRGFLDSFNSCLSNCHIKIEGSREADSAAEYKAYVELLEFFKMWCCIDLLAVVVLMFFVTIRIGAPYWARPWPSFILESRPFCFYCLSFVIVAWLVCLSDYISNVKYYFAMPKYTVETPEEEIQSVKDTIAKD